VTGALRWDSLYSASEIAALMTIDFDTINFFRPGVQSLSKLRGCDVVRLKVEDVAPHGMTVDRAMVRERKTEHSVRSELSEQ
jgi:hypothetical protein